ncbi:hypothetical protein NVP1166O_05 [Vibrio phage 1.166.O._10N.261.51.C7]|nr:hypothetical protein NVP1166O_05 [Vibrio phage 1.166.O._10N.261.51.C7]AUR94029.1 hypothetical protein NVP1190O_05 [Vibrio phage 1.190.O._10N.286.51.F12]
MAFIFHPEIYVRRYLYNNGIHISKLYATSTEDINKTEARKLETLNPEVLKNAQKTLTRLDRSDNRDKIKFNRNIRNTVIGTVQSVLMNAVQKGELKNAPTLVRIIPSTAQEQDVEHARYYGRTMSLEAAINLGFTVRMGCKCGLEFLNNEQEIKKRINSI